jgi:O-antigen ligase
MEIVNFGVWGFGNAIQSPFLDFKILRPQGWFLEPSKLASFLLLPAFVSIGRYRVSRKKIYFLSAFLIFMSILLTLSLAGYFAVVCTVLLLSYSKYFYRNLKKIPVIKYSYVIPIFLIFFGIAYSLLNLTYILNDVDKDSVSENQAVVAELMARDKDGPSGNLVREVYKSDNYINLLKDSPMGVGFGESKSSELRSGNAFLFWFSAGGIPALLAIIILFGYIFLIFCHPLLMSENAVFNALGASFIGHSIQNLSYGNWIEPYFLIHLAIVVMSAKKAKLGIV